MSVRIILHSRAEKLYVAGELDWSSGPTKAREFSNAHAAEDFAREHRLTGMEIIVTRESGLNLYFPLDKPSL